MQMLLGQMQISGRSLQILMTEQQLYGAQVGAGFQQMCGPAVPNQMGAHPLTNAGFLRRLGACMPHGFVADRLLVIAMHARGEQGRYVVLASASKRATSRVTPASRA